MQFDAEEIKKAFGIDLTKVKFDITGIVTNPPSAEADDEEGGED